jgi:hypothetical protein
LSLGHAFSNDMKLPILKSGYSNPIMPCDRVTKLRRFHVAFPAWLFSVVAGLAGLTATAFSQSSPTVGIPVITWNGYLVATAGQLNVPSTTAPVFGTAISPFPTAPAEIATTLSTLRADTTSAVIATAGPDVAGNTYQLLGVFGKAISPEAALAKTSPSGAVSYMRIPLERPATLVRTSTAFYFTTLSVAGYDKVYRLNPDGTYSLVINGPSISYGELLPAPTIDTNDTVTYTVRAPARGAGNIAASNILAAVSVVPYLQPAFSAVTSVPLTPGQTVSLSTNVYSSLPISYQWSYDGAAITGATQASYTGPFLGDGTYTLVATTAAGTVATSTRAQFNVGGIVVGAKPTFLATPVSATIVLGTSTTLRATAAATSPVTFQWAVDGTPISTAGTSTPSTENYGAYDTNLSVTQPGNYTVTATTTEKGGGSVATSVTVKVFDAAGVALFRQPTIVAQPVSVTTLYANGAVTPTGLSVAAVASLPLSYQWSRNGIAIAGATDASYSVTSPGNYAVTVTTSAGNVASQTAKVTAATSAGVAVVDEPTIFGQPRSAGLIFGSGIGLPKLEVSAVALQALTYQWFLNGSPIVGAVSSTYQTSTPGTYTVSVRTDAAAVMSEPAIVSLANRLGNISARCQVGTGANIGIVGFVVSSYTGAAKQILIRGVGPGLSQFGVSGVLTQPILSVFDADRHVVATNSGWKDSAEVATAGVAAGTFPLAAGSADAALLLNLSPGAYTVQISGVGNTTGVALAEIYEVAPDADRLANISARALVGTGGNLLIGGFVTAGDQPSKVLVRAVGPGLNQFALTGTLPRPILSIYNSERVLVGVNVGWSAGGNAEAVAVNDAASRAGAFLLQPGSNDSALLLTLPPGAYTAQVTGADGATGLALVEVYQVPP